jgi:hypothetical protein
MTVAYRAQKKSTLTAISATVESKGILPPTKNLHDAHIIIIVLGSP